jgi:hypothetical protein
MILNHTNQGAFVFNSPCESDRKRWVETGEKWQLEYQVDENYLDQAIELLITIVNGDQPGPRLVLTAAVHGNEINGEKVLRCGTESVMLEAMGRRVRTGHPRFEGESGTHLQPRMLLLDSDRRNRSPLSRGLIP